MQHFTARAGEHARVTEDTKERSLDEFVFTVAVKIKEADLKPTSFLVTPRFCKDSEQGKFIFLSSLSVVNYRHPSSSNIVLFHSHIPAFADSSLELVFRGDDLERLRCVRRAMSTSELENARVRAIATQIVAEAAASTPDPEEAAACAATYILSTTQTRYKLEQQVTAMTEAMRYDDWFSKVSVFVSNRKTGKTVLLADAEEHTLDGERLLFEKVYEHGPFGDMDTPVGFELYTCFTLCAFWKECVRLGDDSNTRYMQVTNITLYPGLYSSHDNFEMSESQLFSLLDVDVG